MTIDERLEFLLKSTESLHQTVSVQTEQIASMRAQSDADAEKIAAEAEKIAAEAEKIAAEAEQMRLHRLELKRLQLGIAKAIQAYIDAAMGDDTGSSNGQG